MGTSSDAKAHGVHEPVGKKRYAKIRGQNGRVLDVLQDSDWCLMRTLPKPPLVCPIYGCSQRMDTVERKQGTRFLRNNRNSGDGCTHLEQPVGGGGPMTEEHLWLQLTIYNLCLEMGYKARLETDYADIRVESNPPVALEVQLRRTDIEKREAQRAKRQMRTLWLFPDTAEKSVDNLLFNHPAVRVKYVREGDPILPPWDPRVAGRTRLLFGATNWKRGDDPTTFIPAGNLRPEHFLREVFEGDRSWYRRSTLHEPSDTRRLWSGWALEDDLKKVLEDRANRDRTAAEARAAEAQRRAKEQEVIAAAHRDYEDRRRRTQLTTRIRNDHAEARRRNDERYRRSEQKALLDAAHRDALREERQRSSPEVETLERVGTLQISIHRSVLGRFRELINRRI